jgi:hypothetical protein
MAAEGPRKIKFMIKRWDITDEKYVGKCPYFCKEYETEFYVQNVRYVFFVT